MNKIILIGRLVADPELRYAAASGTAVTSFVLAVNRRYAKDSQQQADFIKCVCFGKVAENVSKYLAKGSQCAVDGELNIDIVEKNGERSYYTKVNAGSVEFLSKKQGTTESEEAADPMERDFPGVEDDDVPF